MNAPAEKLVESLIAPVAANGDAPAEKRRRARLIGDVSTVAGLHSGIMRLGRYTIRVGLRRAGPTTPADAVPLLLFNGIGANIELLEPLIEALGDLPVITFDVPGVGHSTAPSRPYRPSEIAQLADDLVKVLGYERVDALGVSWGGVIAQEFARRHPATCRRLILAATTSGWFMVPGRIEAMWGMATPRHYFDRGYLRRKIGDIYGGIFRQEPELGIQFMRHVRWQSWRGYYLQLLALVGWTSVHWLPRLRQPTLVMSGDDDPITRPINAKLQVALLRDAQFWRIDCGHLFLLTRARESAEVIRKFLQNT